MLVSFWNIGDIDISEFDEFDYVLLGDIHKTYQVVKEKYPFAAYPGSLIQQNHRRNK